MLAPPAPAPEVVEAVVVVEGDDVEDIDVVDGDGAVLDDAGVVVLAGVVAAAGAAALELELEEAPEPPHPPSRAAALRMSAMSEIRMILWFRLRWGRILPAAGWLQSPGGAARRGSIQS